MGGSPPAFPKGQRCRSVLGVQGIEPRSETTNLDKYFDAKLDLKAVKKIKSTKIQSRLGASKRRENLLGAFKVDKNKLKGVKRVLLVDDVMTTGSTSHILAKSLKKAGVQWVGVFVLLRAF